MTGTIDYHEMTVYDTFQPFHFQVSDLHIMRKHSHKVWANERTNCKTIFIIQAQKDNDDKNISGIETRLIAIDYYDVILSLVYFPTMG